MTGRIIRMKRITRSYVRDNPHILFVFGDNMERRGLGGQAAEARGELNTVGLPTKWRPERDEAAYFNDSVLDMPIVQHALSDAFHRVMHALLGNHDVVISSDGVGTGLAELPKRAPKVHNLINGYLASLQWQMDQIAGFPTSPWDRQL